MSVDEKGYFFFDLLGAMAVMAALAGVLLYIQVQSIYMSDLEGNITADLLAREQLDIICLEDNPARLNTRQVTANQHEYTIISQRQQGDNDLLVHYKVKVQWQNRRGQQEIEFAKDMPATEI